MADAALCAASGNAIGAGAAGCLRSRTIYARSGVARPESRSNPSDAGGGAYAARAPRSCGSSRGGANAAEPAGYDLTYPLLIDDALHGAVVLEMPDLSPEALQQALRQIHWGAASLELELRGGEKATLAKRLGGASSSCWIWSRSPSRSRAFRAPHRHWSRNWRPGSIATGSAWVCVKAGRCACRPYPTVRPSVGR